eukprot:scaffold31206_cov72-Skeletonema_dohrnii-CCMP3373.AAC.1
MPLPHIGDAIGVAMGVAIGVAFASTLCAFINHCATHSKKDQKNETDFDLALVTSELCCVVVAGRWQ